MAVSQEELSQLQERTARRSPRLWTHARLSVLFYLYWLILGTTFLLGCGYCAVIYPFILRRAGKAHGRRVIRFAFWFVMKTAERFGLLHLDLSAVDVLRKEASLILAANHPTLLDVALIGSRLDDMSCIMKAQLWDNIFLGAGARLAGYVRNDPMNTMIRLAADDVAAGSKLLMFPEGTRTLRFPVNPFKGGLALISKRAHAPIQTIFIETSSPYLGKGWTIFRKPELPISYRLRLGQRFAVVDNVEQSLQVLQQYFEAEMNARGEPRVLQQPSLIVPNESA